MQIEVPDGEVVDKITILEIKHARLTDAQQVAHVATELAALRTAWAAQAPMALDAVDGLDRLRVVNAALWDVEDALRARERTQTFDAEFVALARRVYVLNDERAQLKRAISAATGSRLHEQKSYV